MRDRKQRFVQTLAFTIWTLAFIGVTAVGLTPTVLNAGLLDRFRKREIPTDPFLEIAVEEEGGAEKEREKTEEPSSAIPPGASSIASAFPAPPTSVSPVSYATPSEASDPLVRLADARFTTESGGLSSITGSTITGTTDRFGNPIPTASVTVTTPMVEPPPVPESLQLSPERHPGGMGGTGKSFGSTGSPDEVKSDDPL
ncbi:MAG: hypothetical protein Q4C47_00960, partial [Planctomycetia bacterium]|nr:hypothetical protein [Planctomycetia bacterium]